MDTGYVPQTLTPCANKIEYRPMLFDDLHVTKAQSRPSTAKPFNHPGFACHSRHRNCVLPSGQAEQSALYREINIAQIQIGIDKA